MSRKTEAVSWQTESLSRKTGVMFTDITPMFTVIALLYPACILSDQPFSLLNLRVNTINESRPKRLGTRVCYFLLASHL